MCVASSVHRHLPSKSSLCQQRILGSTRATACAACIVHGDCPGSTRNESGCEGGKCRSVSPCLPGQTAHSVPAFWTLPLSSLVLFWFGCTFASMVYLHYNIKRVICTVHCNPCGWGCYGAYTVHGAARRRSCYRALCGPWPSVCMPSRLGAHY